MSVIPIFREQRLLSKTLLQINVYQEECNKVTRAEEEDHYNILQTYSGIPFRVVLLKCKLELGMKLSGRALALQKTLGSILSTSKKTCYLLRQAASELLGI
jgi:heterodisulfide reductase subunit B